jgi:hypothetical protein
VLPFDAALSDEEVTQALRDEHGASRDRHFSPLITLWVFLSVPRYLRMRAGAPRVP